MSNRLAGVIVLLTAALLNLPTDARADAAGDALLAKVIKAYQATQTYHSHIQYKAEQVQGRWSSTQATDFIVKLDRVGNKVLVDKPEFVIVGDGKKLKVVTQQVPGHHVEKNSPAALSYQVLIELVSMPGASLLTQPMTLPDLALLTGKDPLAALAGQAINQVKALPPDPADQAARPGLAFTNFQGDWTLRIDPVTNLVTGAQMLATGSDLEGDYLRLIYEFKVEKHNKPLGRGTFEVDTANSRGSDSLASMFESVRAAQQAAAAGGAGHGGAGGGHPLQGKAAPPIALKTLDGKDFELAKLKADVVVLDFWATWCPPCRRGLPELQKVHDWAVKNGKSVKIVTVNLQERENEVKAFWKQGKFTMPVVMDQTGQTAAAYGVNGIPQTVIITGGKVQTVHVGLLPDLAKSLQGEIEETLEKIKTAGQSTN